MREGERSAAEGSGAGLEGPDYSMSIKETCHEVTGLRHPAQHCASEKREEIWSVEKFRPLSGPNFEFQLTSKKNVSNSI